MEMEMIMRRMAHWPYGDVRRRSSRFRSNWSNTRALLVAEVRHLGGYRVVVELQVEDRDFRIDGNLRADARPQGPNVIVSFKSKHGPMQYPCATFPHWQDNVRAIAMALEALRKVDRYGVTAHGEQYRGFTALPAPEGEESAMDITAAAAFVASTSQNGVCASNLLSNPDRFAVARKHAALRLHPDQGGNEHAFKRLMVACRLIEAHHAEPRR